MDQLGRITTKITEIIESAEDKSVLGVRLGAALKAAFPSFTASEYQCKNLRQFVKKHVPAVVEKQHSGVDVVYTVSSQADTEATMQQPSATPQATVLSLPADTVAWKAYSNPSYPFVLIANPTTGEVKAVGERDTPPAGWVQIPKLGKDKHLQIATEFTESLPDSIKSSLQPVLADPQWYVSFFGIAKRLGVSRQYGLFKREHLIRYFTAALHDHGINAASAAPKHDLVPGKLPGPRKMNDVRRSTYRDDLQLRDLVATLASTLPIDELRSLRVPIGLVLDALKR